MKWTLSSIKAEQKHRQVEGMDKVEYYETNVKTSIIPQNVLKMDRKPTKWKKEKPLHLNSV